VIPVDRSRAQPVAGRAENLLGAAALLASDGMQRSREQLLGPGRASSAAALAALTTFGSLTVDRLSSALGVSHSGATRVVDRLEEQGWVTRTAGADTLDGDRRAVVVTLTPSGSDTARRVLAARQEALGRVLAPLSRAERSLLADLLGKLVESQVAGRDELRRVCRLCDHSVCLPCPALQSVEATESEAALRP
jgi:MarR family transcriptional regulator, negative regulator of the multidrug operon emrRAB